MSVAVSTLVGDAWAELNVFQPGQLIPAPQATFALRWLNRIINQWNAKREAVYCELFTSFTLVPNLSPHTIGPSGATFTMAIRPVTLDGCSLVLNDQTPDVYTAIEVIDWRTYQGLSVPGISTSIPTAVYYEKDWPKGKLFFYPIPNYAYNVRLATRALLAEVTLVSTLDLPVGYEPALLLTLAETIATASGRAVPAKTEQGARDARALIFANNADVPLLNLNDGQGTSARTDFNYRSRQFS